MAGELSGRFIWAVFFPFLRGSLLPCGISLFSGGKKGGEHISRCFLDLFPPVPPASFFFLSPLRFLLSFFRSFFGDFLFPFYFQCLVEFFLIPPAEDVFYLVCGDRFSLDMCFCGTCFCSCFQHRGGTQNKRTAWTKHCCVWRSMLLSLLDKLPPRVRGAWSTKKSATMYHRAR